AGCSAGIFASLMGLNPRNIASAGGCHLITRSLHRPIRSGVRQWQSKIGLGRKSQEAVVSTPEVVAARPLRRGRKPRSPAAE
ncbi:MAG TPA: hypothetical protein VNY09_03715, partial [Candidatus Sulfotelmatobacter sp.]|nr:hypothetical protein [Candidatus Sulfotelmatobacter sp.]